MAKFAIAKVLDCCRLKFEQWIWIDKVDKPRPALSLLTYIFQNLGGIFKTLYQNLPSLSVGVSSSLKSLAKEVLFLLQGVNKNEDSSLEPFFLLVL